MPGTAATASVPSAPQGDPGRSGSSGFNGGSPAYSGGGAGFNGAAYGGGGGTGGGRGTGYDDEPGHTRSAFTIGEPGDDYGPPQQPAFSAVSESPSAYQSEAHVTTYRAGTSHPQVGGERLPWRAVLVGIYRHPNRTFTQMRGHQVWALALIVSAVYGAIAVFGFADTRSGVLNSTFSLALVVVLISAVSIILAGLMFGEVTHVLARRLGGDGAWAPTVGFAMLVSWTTDVPRLLFSLFLPVGNNFVQALGWATWLLAAWLLTAMVRQLHDLPWGKAAGAAAIQLIALLIVIKLPTLG